MSIVIFWLFFAVLVGIYANRRGRSGFGWFMLAVLISPLLAFLLCLALGSTQTPTATNEPNPDTHVKCPDCRELVLYDARVCKHCGAKLVPQEAIAPVPASRAPLNFGQVWQRNKAIIVVLAVIGLLAAISSTR